MKNQVLTKEQMEHLRGLGVNVGAASVAGVKMDNNTDVECYTDRIGVENKDIIPFARFTLQDILELLPRELDAHKTVYLLNVCLNQDEWVVSYYRDESRLEYFIGSNILEEAYNMLVWCAENGYLKGGKQ